MTAAIEETPKSLNRLKDRCDRCGAQAFVMVERDGKELIFCAHDYHKNEYTLATDGWVVSIDNRAEINEQPSLSASVD